MHLQGHINLSGRLALCVCVCVRVCVCVCVSESVRESVSEYVCVREMEREGVNVSVVSAEAFGLVILCTLLDLSFWNQSLSRLINNPYHQQMSPWLR